MKVIISRLGYLQKRKTRFEGTGDFYVSHQEMNRMKFRYKEIKDCQLLNKLFPTTKKV